MGAPGLSDCLLEPDAGHQEELGRLIGSGSGAAAQRFQKDIVACQYQRDAKRRPESALDITDAQSHENALARIQDLYGAIEDSAEEQDLMDLVDAVAAHEASHTF